MFDDTTYGDFDYFLRTLSNPSNVFFELEGGAGLVSFTSVQPRVDALLHFIFYDKKLKGKEWTVNQILGDMFELGKLNRISCAIPEDRITGVKLVKRLGFKQEGMIRGAFLRNNCYLNVGIYGLMHKEYHRREDA